MLSLLLMRTQWRPCPKTKQICVSATAEYMALEKTHTAVCVSAGMSKALLQP